MKYRHGYTALIITLAFGISTTSPVFAETSAKVLEEIVVTARKREESVLEVPISLNTFSAKDIERANITDIRDVTSLSPSLNYNAAASIGGGGRVNPNTTFRGMQNGTPVPQEQVSSTFVDGIYVTGGPQAINTFDIERIEVLKGPQTVYFGRSTFGGAINYITKNPGDEYAGTISADLANHESSRVSIAHEGPIGDSSTNYRISAGAYTKGAMYQSSTDGGDLGRESTRQVSLTLLSEPGDNTSIKFRASYQEDDDSSAAITIVPGNTASCNGFSFNTQDGPVATPSDLAYFCGQTVPSLGDLGESILSANTSLDNIYVPTGTTLGDVFVNNSVNDPYIGGDFPRLDRFGLKREALRLSVQADHEFTSGLSLEGSVGYNESNAAAIIDIDGIGAPDSFGYVPIKLEDLSAEVRLRGSEDGPLRWLAGINYYDGEICCEFTGSTRNIYFIGFGPGSSGRHTKYETLGVFGSLEYDFSDSLTLAAEVRYQEDSVLAVASNTEDTFDDVTPRVILNWSPSDDTNVYASYSVGVLPGQVNTNFIGRPQFQKDQIIAQVGSVSDVVDSDQLDNFEVGIKQQLMGGRMQYALSVYMAEWSNKKVSQNIQVSAVPGGALAPANSVVINGDMDLFGVEFEASMLLSDKWTVHGAVAFNETEYQRIAVGSLQNVFNTQNFNGKSEPQNPEWSGNIDLTYSDQFCNDWDWYTRVDARFRGKSYLSAANIAELDSYVTLDGAVGFERDDLTIEMYVTNALDQDNWVSGGNIVQIGGIGLGGLISGRFQGALVQAPDKRQFGVKASYRF